jgi:hypothetical protein
VANQPFGWFRVPRTPEVRGATCSRDTGDPLAPLLVDEIAEVLTAGVALSKDCWNRPIGSPQECISEAAVCAGLEVVGAQLYGDVGVVGAANLAMQDAIDWPNGD